MTTTFIIAAIAAWLGFGWLACRRLVRDWFDTFGNYDRMPSPLLIGILPFGVIGWLGTFVVAPPKWAPTNIAARIFGGQS